MKRNSKGQFIKGSNGNDYRGWGIWYDSKGYPCIWIAGKDVRLHVYVWEEANGNKPEGFDVHHIDFDKSNYSLDNLELLSHSDHMRVHAGWIKTNGEWTHKPCNRCKKILPLSDFYPRKGFTPSALCKVCHNKTITEKHANAGILLKNKLKIYKHDWYLKNKGRTT